MICQVEKYSQTNWSKMSSSAKEKKTKEQSSERKCDASTPEEQKFENYLQPLNNLGTKENLKISFANIPLNHNHCAADFKHKLKAENKDLKTSASYWTVERFFEYFSTLKTSYSGEELPKLQGSDEMFEAITDSFTNLGEVFKDDDTETILKLLSTKSHNEHMTRVFIDALIIPIVQENDMILRLEDSMNINGLPTARSDYTIYTPYGKPLGCIETKSNIERKSVVQGILQLLSLREKAKNTLFNIITDAYHYIFILYNQYGTLQVQVNKNGGCKVHVTDDINGVKEMAKIINALLKRGKAEIEAEAGKSDEATGGQSRGGEETTDDTTKKAKTGPKRGESTEDTATTRKKDTTTGETIEDATTRKKVKSRPMDCNPFARKK